MQKKSKFDYIKIQDLVFDYESSRFPIKHNGTEKDAINYMLLEASTLELMQAIGENGFFEGEQLLVVPKGNGKYKVVEGNRRLTSVMLLNNPELAQVKKVGVKQIHEEAEHKNIQNIPCLVFDKKEDIVKYLGFRHITGIKSWRLLEKGRYLLEMKNSDYKNVSFLQACREMAKSIGSSSSYIRRLLTSVELYKIVEDEDFYSIDNLNDTRFHLNYFADALNKEHIRHFLGVDFNKEDPLKELQKDRLKEITQWWFKETEGRSRVLGDSESLKMLDAVIQNPKALESFRNGISIEYAYELTDDLELLFQKEIEKSLRAIEQADVYSNKINHFYTGLYDDLKSINDIAKKIKNYQQQKEREDDNF